MNQRGFAPLLIILIAAAAIALGGYAYFRSKTPPRGYLGPPVLTCCDKERHWNTYRDEKYGYEVGYPSTWFARKTANCVTSYGYISVGVTFGPKDYSGFHLCRLSDAEDRLTLEQYLDLEDKASQTAYEGRPSLEVISTERITVAALPAIQRKELAGGFTTINTYLKRDRFIYSFSLLVGSAGKFSDVDEKIYNQILSTFKFIPSASAG